MSEISENVLLTTRLFARFLIPNIGADFQRRETFAANWPLPPRTRFSDYMIMVIEISSEI
jgi:hypothetical protein